MSLTPHEVLVERIDKFIHPVYWSDTNLYSVLEERGTGVEACLTDIEYWEVPGMGNRMCLMLSVVLITLFVV